MKWTDEENKLLAELYPHTITSELIGIFNRSSDAIQKHAEESRIYKSKEYKFAQAIVRGNLASHPRTYELNHNYFHDIDTPEKSYFTGLIWADGCVIKKREQYKVNLTLKNEDGYLLHYLKEVTLSEYPIYETGIAKMYSVASKIMFHDLVSHGITPMKTYCADTPIGIPNDLVSHFIRGVFDGDGCIMVRHNKYRSVDIVGTYNFCVWLQEVFDKYLNIKAGVYKNGSVFSVIFSKKRDVTNYKNWIYGNCGKYFMTRKYKKFELNGDNNV